MKKSVFITGGTVGTGRDTERMNVLGGAFSKDGNRGNKK